LSYLSLQTAKETLCEVFQARLEDAKEMIRQRMGIMGVS